MTLSPQGVAWVRGERNFARDIAPPQLSYDPGDQKLNLSIAEV